MSTLPLAHLVLHKLSEQPLTGYSLCQEIEESTGKRPSYGSIYPILERMAHEGMVTAKEEGRKKIYTLTAKGRAATGNLKERHDELLDQMIQQSRTFCEVTGSDPAPMISMLERLKRGEDPLKGVSTNAILLRDTLFRLSAENRIKPNQEQINTILKDTIKKLERLT